MRMPPKVVTDAGRHRLLRETLQRQLKLTPIQLRRIERSCLWDYAVAHWRAQHPEESRSPDSKDVRHRLIVCFLRHEASNYDDILDCLYALPLSGATKFLLHKLLKQQVLAVIAKAYPEFHEACRVQFRETRSRCTRQVRNAA